MPELRKKYPFDRIEPKWQRYWAEHKTFAAREPEFLSGQVPESPSHASSTPALKHSGTPAPKLYVLDMFPYPSGAGLHVGHPEGYTATDIYCRFQRMRGLNVLHPMGWDAFGLPAEQYAIKTGTHPAITTRQNVETFRRQVQMLGFSYDWDREVDTTDPEYFKWTQWIFLQLFKKGLAYESHVPVWWCDGCKTVLANEEVNADGTCKEKGHPGVVRRPLRQWVLKITAYAERLLKDLDLVNWPDSIKEQQRNWIGRSEGAEVTFLVLPAGLAQDKKALDVFYTQFQNDPSFWAKGGFPHFPSGDFSPLKVFTTRPDTLFGATYMVVAPEHPLVRTVIHKKEVAQYVEAAARKSELERTSLEKQRQGCRPGYSRSTRSTDNQSQSG